MHFKYLHQREKERASEYNMKKKSLILIYQKILILMNFKLN
jgi:hypothetical protein